jgi:cell division protein FtsX
MKSTWKPIKEEGKLSTADKNDLPESAFAFPKKRKEPLTDAGHVRNAIARFDQVEGVNDEDRDQAWANIKKAAEYFKIDVNEKSWHELMHK